MSQYSPTFKAVVRSKFDTSPKSKQRFTQKSQPQRHSFSHNECHNPANEDTRPLLSYRNEEQYWLALPDAAFVMRHRRALTAQMAIDWSPQKFVSEPVTEKLQYHLGPYLPLPDEDAPSEFLECFQPQFPPDPNKPFEPGNDDFDPIPVCESVEHAILVRNALTQFHLMVYLAMEAAGEHADLRHKHFKKIVDEYMPAMSLLRIRPQHIVFFYHGRFMQAVGTSLWHLMTGWEQRTMQEAKAKKIESTAGSHKDTWSTSSDAGESSRKASDVDSAYGSTTTEEKKRMRGWQMTDGTWNDTKGSEHLDASEWPKLGKR